jgi:hypothetical protein
MIPVLVQKMHNLWASPRHRAAFLVAKYYEAADISEQSIA